MVCKNCYYNNESNAKFCVKCGAELQPEVVTQNTSNNNTQNNVNYENQDTTAINYSPASAIVALVMSLLCCSNVVGLIFSILALIEGGKINPFILNGNIESAKASLAQYKKWTKYAWISMAIWTAAIILISVVYFVFIIGMIAISAD